MLIYYYYPAMGTARIGFNFYLRSFTFLFRKQGFGFFLRLCITLQWLQSALLGGGTGLVLLLTDQDPVWFGGALLVLNRLVA